MLFDGFKSRALGRYFSGVAATNHAVSTFHYHRVICSNDVQQWFLSYQSVTRIPVNERLFHTTFAAQPQQRERNTRLGLRTNTGESFRSCNIIDSLLHCVFH
jgi:hypothetical protein